MHMRVPQGLLAGAILLLVAACGGTYFPADVSGGASFNSPTQSGAKASIQFNTQSLCKDGSATCDEAGLYYQKLTGNYKDLGKNVAWPYGVSMSFNGKLMPGDPDPFISKLHGIAVGGAFPCYEGAGVVDPSAPDAMPMCWYGVATYRTTDTRHYTNTPITSCTPDLAAYAPDFGYTWSKTNLSGLLLVVLADSDFNGKPNKGDGIFVEALCGPYANLAAKDGVPYTYSYASCPANVADSDLVGGTIWSSYAWYGGNLGEELYYCFAPMTNGNIKITPIVLPSSSPSLPPA